MNYNFFDYKHFIEGYHGQDFFSKTHIVAMIVLTLLIVALLIIFRKAKTSGINKYLKILAIVNIISEIIKIVWESYYDIKLGYGFNWTGVLPFYTCSMFTYALPIAAWGKGKIKEMAVCWLSTIGVFAGFTNFYLTQMLHTYPFWTYSTFGSLSFHFMMVFTGLFLVVTRYKRFDFKDIISAWIPLAVFSIVVIPICYYFKADYMLYYYGNGAPILPQIANFFASHNLRFIYTLFVMFGYMAIAGIFVSIYKFIDFLILKFKKNN